MTDKTPSPAPAPTVTRIEPGSDACLTLLMVPHGLHAVTGKDRQDLLAFARDVWQAALVAPASQKPCRCGPDGCADSSCPGRRP